MLPEKIRELEVSIGDNQHAGQLRKASTYEFRYQSPDPEQLTMALLMPPSKRLTWQDGDLFPPMDQNLPEGDLFLTIRALFPKQPMTPMHLLAMVGRNGIGRLGYTLGGATESPAPRTLSKEELIKTKYSPAVFHELVAAYLSTGAGIAGMQPKIMVPDRPTLPVPSLIVKAASASYPGLAANEFMCLSAARNAGIEVPEFALKVFAGKGQSKAYPTRVELHDFGRRVCGVSQPAQTVKAIAEGMRKTLEDAKGDDRVPAPLRVQMAAAWETGLMYDVQ